MISREQKGKMMLGYITDKENRYLRGKERKWACLKMG